MVDLKSKIGLKDFKIYKKMTNKTVKKLKPIAKRLVLKGYSKLTKAEFIKLLEAHMHNESANKLRSFSKELAASHRSAVIKQIDSKVGVALRKVY